MASASSSKSDPAACGIVEFRPLRPAKKPPFCPPPSSFLVRFDGRDDSELPSLCFGMFSGVADERVALFGGDPEDGGVALGLLDRLFSPYTFSRSQVGHCNCALRASVYATKIWTQVQQAVQMAAAGVSFHYGMRHLHVILLVNFPLWFPLVLSSNHDIFACLFPRPYSYHSYTQAILLKPGDQSEMVLTVFLGALVERRINAWHKGR